jgi:FMN phosphatase YigB (HAD superfamily)
VEPAIRRAPARRDGQTSGYRYDAVLFGFHGTLAQVEDAVRWVQAAAASCGVPLEESRATALADRYVLAGRAGGPKPRRIPPQLAEAYANRDLYEYAFEEAYGGLIHTVDHGLPDAEGLADALFQRVLHPDGWVLYPETRDVLAALRAAGVPIAIVSNIGFDIRPMFEVWDCGRMVESYSLSFEVGRLKPDPALFRHACRQLQVDPERTLMVGNSPADSAAVEVGLSAFILPTGAPGVRNGLSAVLDLVGVGCPLTE